MLQHAFGLELLADAYEADRQAYRQAQRLFADANRGAASRTAWIRRAAGVWPIAFGARLAGRGDGRAVGSCATVRPVGDGVR